MVPSPQRAKHEKATKRGERKSVDVVAKVRAVLRSRAELDGTAIETLLDACAFIAGDVPLSRRADWEKLLAGFRAKESEERRRLRIEALLRALELVELARVGPALLDRPLGTFGGIGPAHHRALEERGLVTARDLLWRLPVGYDDRASPQTIAEAKARDGARVVVAAKVKSAIQLTFRGRRGVRVVVTDDSGSLTGIWFYPAKHILALARPGTEVLMIGRVLVRPQKPVSIIHPEVVVDTPEARVLKPRYARAGVPESVLARIRGSIVAALAAGEESDLRPHVDPVPETFHGKLLHDETSAVAAFGAAHRLSTLGGPSLPAEVAHALLQERWMFAEAYHLVRDRLLAERDAGDAPKIARSKHVEKRLLGELGFALTAGQARVLPEIAADMATTTPMRRLLLGDVGTGKTAVAMFALAACVDRGYQAAVLAPTTVLAEQYLEALAPLARAAAVSIVLVTGRGAIKDRTRIVRGLAAGTFSIAVGTHALFQNDVTFARLGLVVVDEQQRLGVAQRLALVRKGKQPHMLSLTATPIPRTLALALRGHVKTSRLDERPRGRKPVETRIVPLAAWEEVVADIRAACQRGEQVFFVTPSIDPEGEDDERPTETDAVGAEVRAELLAARLAPHGVAFAHGRMSAGDLSRAMSEFRAGKTRVLVATTVIEVGLDIPGATRMIIERADRYGLSQLHQLRGRVGRGDRPGVCVLLHDDDLSARGRERLEALVTHDRGEDIAKMDLAFRGPGELWGTRQWGSETEGSHLGSVEPPPWIESLEAWVNSTLVDRRGKVLSSGLPALDALSHRFKERMASREEAG